MHRHRLQSDGQLRASDNWQKGIPREQYMKSLWRHMMAAWSAHRGLAAGEDVEEALCAMLFNVQGYLHEHLTDIDLCAKLKEAMVKTEFVPPKLQKKQAGKR